VPSRELAHYSPPDLTLQADDILFLDLGPVFEQWEADFGRTFALGSDPLKHQLQQDVGKAFAERRSSLGEKGPKQRWIPEIILWSKCGKSVAFTRTCSPLAERCAAIVNH